MKHPGPYGFGCFFMATCENGSNQLSGGGNHFEQLETGLRVTRRSMLQNYQNAYFNNTAKKISVGSLICQALCHEVAKIGQINITP
jgi:hypothetical protein